ncbi:MAG: hypothetical protein WCF90_01455 [Methanomicrobiales archaeon]
MGGAVENYLSTPEGQEATKKHIASAEGTARLKGFVGTTEGKKTFISVLSMVRGILDIFPRR